jgi:hypothetical protein
MDAKFYRAKDLALMFSVNPETIKLWCRQGRITLCKKSNTKGVPSQSQEWLIGKTFKVDASKFSFGPKSVKRLAPERIINARA